MLLKQKFGMPAPIIVKINYTTCNLNN
ncbi:hypothetical protein CAXC1_220040 [Candidatus Xenohaliotis californiensis]|uniref:Uncharacterized protein n=1 Tax=Candidatus Xenohaliotis californiensis TaxID=84677 RepID=A0ABM9N7V5_9RICK|nr:hypothetical protein CAXC1_220040 [Candidatus Xenohaliotis californiensis]